MERTIGDGRVRNTGYDYEQTDGFGNTTRTTYDNFGRVTSTIDALGYATTSGYDALGRQTSVTDPLTNAVTTAYDAEGRVVSQRGATYPVDYTYDAYGNKVSMTTYRNESLANGDTTRWLYDEPSGCMTNKVYADGKGPRYDYTPDGKLARRTWARGVVTDYTYDSSGQLVLTTYSDDTPPVSLAYNRAGRQIEAHDAAGITTFAYDAFGANTNESVVGVAGTNVLERFYDALGRNTGYALNGTRQTTLAYDPATGRLATMTTATGGAGVPPAQGGCGVLAASNENGFHWTYLPGSDIKSSLTYPNGLTASWRYDANDQLLQVRNATLTNVISQFDYTYDAAGRRTAIAKSGSALEFDDVVSYGYNARSELTNAVAAVDANYRYSYQYDPIGNRESSSERGTNTTYAANGLNQYTQIAAANEDAFIPEFDDDGNQTIVKTATGVWRVTYNGENRPILWACDSGNQTLTMVYDYIGRRWEKDDRRFFYDGYLQIADNGDNVYAWDCTEAIATRPLAWIRSDSDVYYAHDGNKNDSDVIASNGSLAAHYEYAPFGVVILQCGESAIANPWRFSGEYTDDELGCDYYNYREYELMTGRWLGRDPIEDLAGQHSYIFECNAPTYMVDPLGLVALNFSYSWGPTRKSFMLGPWFEGDISMSGNASLSGEYNKGIIQGWIKGISKAEVGGLVGKSFGMRISRYWNVMGRAGIRLFVGAEGGVKGGFKYNVCTGRGSAEMEFPLDIYGGAEVVAKLTIYKYYKWGNQYGGGYKMPYVYEIGATPIKALVSGGLKGKISCDEKVCYLRSVLNANVKLSAELKLWRRGISVSQDVFKGERALTDVVLKSPLRLLAK